MVADAVPELAPAGCRRSRLHPVNRKILSPFPPSRRYPAIHLIKASVRISRGVESLFGTRDENIRLLESGLGVHTQLVDNSLEIEGEADKVSRVENILSDYNSLMREG